MYKLIVIIMLLANLATYAQTEGELTVQLLTNDTGGKYAPRNVMAIWVENSSGEFVKTLLAYGDKRKTHLNTWQEATSNAGSEFNVTDAITGATKSSHSTRTCNWNGFDYNSTMVNDGQYKLCMELTDKNETGNYSIFDFNKDTIEYNLSPPDEPSFKSIQINWSPSQTSSFENIEVYNSYEVYPNPTTGIINIKGENIELININDFQGQLLISSKNETLNISKYPKGIYFISIQTSEGIVVKKITKN